MDNSNKFYKCRPNGLNGALQNLGIKFDGREHSGFDDARNTANLAWRMSCDGCHLNITKTIKMDAKGKFTHVSCLPTTGNCRSNSTKLELQLTTAALSTKPKTLFTIARDNSYYCPRSNTVSKPFVENGLKLRNPNVLSSSNGPNEFRKSNSERTKGIDVITDSRTKLKQNVLNIVSEGQSNMFYSRSKSLKEVEVSGVATDNYCTHELNEKLVTPGRSGEADIFHQENEKEEVTSSDSDVNINRVGRSATNVVGKASPPVSSNIPSVSSLRLFSVQKHRSDKQISFENSTTDARSISVSPQNSILSLASAKLSTNFRIPSVARLSTSVEMACTPSLTVCETSTAGTSKSYSVSSSVCSNAAPGKAPCQYLQASSSDSSISPPIRDVLLTKNRHEATLVNMTSSQCPSKIPIVSTPYLPSSGTSKTCTKCGKAAVVTTMDTTQKRVIAPQCVGASFSLSKMSVSSCRPSKCIPTILKPRVLSSSSKASTLPKTHALGKNHTTPIVKASLSIAVGTSAAMNSTITTLCTPNNNTVPVSTVTRRTPPLCTCGRRARRRLVQNPGPNAGRWFFTCSVRWGSSSEKTKLGCQFFQWDSAHTWQCHINKSFTPVLYH